MPTPEQPDERSAISSKIVALEQELELLHLREQKTRKKISRSASVANRALLYILFGPRLTKSLGALLHSSREKSEPLLGSKLATVLDAASRRMTGYKRWAVAFGIIASLPGIISLVLIWQQHNVVKRETNYTLADIANRSRLDLLLTIYTSTEKDPEGAPMTPTYPAKLRAEAALKLIESDTASYKKVVADRGEDFLWRVDLSQAPLGHINFSGSEAEPPRELVRVSFIASNLDHSSFHRCQLTEVWFDFAKCIFTDFRGANLDRVFFGKTELHNVDFTGATFTNCDFKGATFTAGTKWPQGFDPIAAGAILLSPPQKGDSQ